MWTKPSSRSRVPTTSSCLTPRTEFDWEAICEDWEEEQNESENESDNESEEEEEEESDSWSSDE